MACGNLELANQARKQIIAKYHVDESNLDIIQLDIEDTKSIDLGQDFCCKMEEG